jgi:hypothetical protein
MKNYNQRVVSIVEEMQGASSPQQGPMATPGKGGKGGQSAQKIVQGVQGVADASAQSAADKLQSSIAQQQGIDPANAQNVNKNLNAQPRPTRPPVTTQVRGIQNDANSNRNMAQKGKEVQAECDREWARLERIIEEENKVKFDREWARLERIVEEENKAEEINDANVPKGAEEKLANPDDKDDFNDQKEQTKRAKERAKQISVKSAGPKETSTMGVDGKGKGQKHHEVTGKKKTEESIFSDDERNALLDWYFG